jgi:hypothetical protein
MFDRMYQHQIFAHLNDNFYRMNSGMFFEYYGHRYDIMCYHLTLTFLPFSDLSLRFIDTYFQSLLMNTISLLELPFIIIGSLVEFIFTGNTRFIGDIFESIFNILLTLIILTLEITSGILSLVTKPLITLGFLVAYTPDFMIDLFRTPEIVEEPNKLANLENLDALLLYAPQRR